MSSFCILQRVASFLCPTATVLPSADTIAGPDIAPPQEYFLKSDPAALLTSISPFAQMLTSFPPRMRLTIILRILHPLASDVGARSSVLSPAHNCSNFLSPHTPSATWKCFVWPFNVDSSMRNLFYVSFIYQAHSLLRMAAPHCFDFLRTRRDTDEQM